MTPSHTTTIQSGYATIWDVYRQRWATYPVGAIPAYILATLEPSERRLLQSTIPPLSR